MRSTLAFQISLMDCSAGDDDGGGACSGEAKPPLSHTHSLPTPKHKPSQRSSSEEGRSATTGETSENDEKTSTSSQSSNVRGSRAGSERHHSKLGHPKHSVSSGISRSQSVRTKGSSNKVSFSNLPFKCLNNKNRLCSRTCGIDKITKFKKIAKKFKHYFKDCKPSMDPTPKRNLIFESQIPPQREIWSQSPGSHPEENLGWENRKARDPEVGHQTAPPHNNNNSNNNSHSSKT